ncbi:MAG: alpha/beta fold hydrolase, partial [Candidatus Dependentiae bacterium]|nr:alpha/beta fold hydrolase [Candidatus Dependentiae bacterium]
MIKKIQFFIFIHLIFMAAAAQACAPLINCPEGRNLSYVKQQIKNAKIEDIIITPFVDATRQETFQRRGMLVRKDKARGTVVMCHGYLGCKRDTIALKHLFPQYNIVVFDFRAHGDDREGQVSTIGRDEALDVLAAVEFVKSDDLMKDKPIIAYGFSMGAVSAIQAQAMEGNLFDAMILDCPYDSTDDAMSRGLDEKMQFTLFGKKFMIPGKQFILDHMYDEFAQMFTNFLFQAITKFDSNKVATKFV